MHFSLPAYDAGQRPAMEPSSAIRSGKFRVPNDAILVSRLNPRIARVWAPTCGGSNAIASHRVPGPNPKDVRESDVPILVVLLAAVLGRHVACCYGNDRQSSASESRRCDEAPPSDFLRIFPNNAPSPLSSPTWTPRSPRWSAVSDKTRAIKQGMMQQLLTGSIRLPIPDDDTGDDAHDA